ncbi:MAG: potassium transporter Kup [Deltaproteobacteria bacterium]|nr:potassium transporter Kup [Deltaproteobacteria bacterium]
MENSNSAKENGVPWALTLGALGVVFGDIGTSPLYAMRECFTHSHGLVISHDNILGILSLIFWSLIIIISIKYLLLVMRADNRGEGGMLALMALATSASRRRPSQIQRSLIFLGLFGTALLYGESVITPAISVLSAVEGLHIVTERFDPYVIPLTMAILVGLFVVQRHGTARIGAMFGPIIAAWFITMGILGFAAAIKNPEVFWAINPAYAGSFLVTHGVESLYTLGGVFLVVTGGEALYTDMGHFGRKPIQLAWFFAALPGLFFNYMGQGALLLQSPEALKNPFFLLAPSWFVIPLVVLATLATVIASQAVITGAFSLTRQAVQLGYLPRLEIRHTSQKEIGQIYVPLANWSLLVMTLWLVLEFKTSSSLAAAYGISVSTAMVITTILILYVTFKVWNWPLITSITAIALFFIADLVFVSANIIKIKDGGWVPLALGIVIFTVMTTWRRGRNILGQRLGEVLIPLDEFLKSIGRHPPPRIPGSAIFMCKNNQRVPPALLHNVRHNKVLHERVILLQVSVEEVPYLEEESRVQLSELENGFQLMTISFGFMEDPDVVAILQAMKGEHRINDLDQVTFFLGRETVFATGQPGMALWRERLFALMSRNARPATNFFNIPTDRVVEIGLQVEI